MPVVHSHPKRAQAWTVQVDPAVSVREEKKHGRSERAQLHAEVIAAAGSCSASRWLVFRESLACVLQARWLSPDPPSVPGDTFAR